NSNQLNKATPPNGKNSQEFRRDDLRNVGHFKLIFAPGSVSDSLNFFNIHSSAKYSVDPAEKLDGSIVKKESSVTSVVIGTTLNGFEFSLPLQLEVEYEHVLAGADVVVATNALQATVK